MWDVGDKIFGCVERILPIIEILVVLCKKNPVRPRKNSDHCEYFANFCRPRKKEKC